MRWFMTAGAMTISAHSVILTYSTRQSFVLWRDLKTRLEGGDVIPQRQSVRTPEKWYLKYECFCNHLSWLRIVNHENGRSKRTGVIGCAARLANSQSLGV